MGEKNLIRPPDLADVDLECRQTRPGPEMKTSVLLALIGKIFALMGAESMSPFGASPHSFLMLIGLSGLALLTLRSERWRIAHESGH